LNNKKIYFLKGELDLKDLPPIADLTITVPEEKCFLIGHVKSCVDNLVVVESIKGLPAIDLVILDTFKILTYSRSILNIFFRTLFFFLRKEAKLWDTFSTYLEESIIHVIVSDSIPQTTSSK